MSLAAVPVAALVVLGCKSAGSPAVTKAEDEAASCRSCHAAVVESHAATVHAHSTSPATEASVRGSFAPGRNVVSVGQPSLSLVMERREGGLFQVFKDAGSGTEQARRMDVVFGSGRNGQAYMYWRGKDLLLLPACWLPGADSWVPGPGAYAGPGGPELVVPQRCLECHTGGQLKPGDGKGFGVSCASCHGDGAAHVAWHQEHPGEKGGRDIVNPHKGTREQALEGCALCHSGSRQVKTPEFSWKPGEPLDAHLGAPTPGADMGDSHGNQVGLLERSKCFQGSPTMTCSTCHEPHRSERSLAVLAKACTDCHAAPKHTDPSISAAPSAGCVECHMPLVPTGFIRLATPTGMVSPKYRSHAIGLYPGGQGAGPAK
jgi:hypothetical protein